MKALWIYWIRGDDEVELTDEESSNDMDEVAENHEWYEALEDSELKDEALRNKAIKNGFIKDDDNDDDDDDESRYEQMRRWNIYTNYDDAYEINHEDNKREELCEDHEIPVCNIRRYMMINYSFNNNEEYVAVKKDEYNDFTITREEACRACLPRNLSDYGRRMDGPRERNIDEVGGMHIFWNSVVLYKVEDIATCLVEYVKFWDDWEVDRYGNANLVIMEYLVNISKRRAFWSLNEDILKITILKTNTPYPSRKIRRIRACTHQRPQRNKAQYAVSRRPIRRIGNMESI
ncbi:hypothetical protein Tco_0951739 [Tanacetum coccineum]|uniref:Uncharacterized protein n=1 Tax=Tanacetum coccineum TaxID=301880 RepID=A0ABQ5DVX0_9ASTR